MDKELNCHFYFGDQVDTPLALMNYNELAGYQKTVVNQRIPGTGFVWQEGVWKLIFKPYKHYIISSSEGYASNWVLLIVGRILGKKVYPWTHGMKGVSRGKAKSFKKLFYKLCHRILLYGEFSKNFMMQEGFKNDKLWLINNSLDHENQLLIRQTLRPNRIFIDYFENEYPVIAYIGRIQKSKKLGMLIEALSSLNSKGVLCNLVLIGNKTDDASIEGLVKKHGVTSQVWFYGPCYEENVIAPLLYNSDVCVSPGPIGLTAIHSLTFGLPVITNNDLKNQMPEFEAITPGVTGDFFEKDNLEDLCSKIEQWINLAPEKREMARIAAYRVIDQKYNPTYQIKVLKRALELDRP
jgi:glycosyltransferase involved in cell wall biosynthesis